jgi:hypothetical protein
MVMIIMSVMMIMIRIMLVIIVLIRLLLTIMMAREVAPTMISILTTMVVMIMPS